MEEKLSDHAQVMLKIMRLAIAGKLFPAPFTPDVINVILVGLELSETEYQICLSTLKSEIFPES